MDDDVVNIAAYREDLRRLLAASTLWVGVLHEEGKDSLGLQLAIERIRSIASVGERLPEGEGPGVGRGR